MPSRRVLVFVLLLGAVLGVGVAVGAGAPAQSDAPNASDAANATNDSDTVRHRNPETYNREGNTEALGQRLASQLSDRLQGSTLNLSSGEYEAANDSLGGEYRDLLSQYVDVAGDTEQGTESAQAFESAAEAQQEYVGAVARYRETYEAYRRAERAGNTTRMRTLARELDRLAERINGTSRQVTESYATIENTTGEETPDETVSETAANVTATQAAISDSLFVDSRLSLTAPNRTASFLDPLSLRGRVVDENGTPLANRTVTLRIGGARIGTATDANGSFVASYRPVAAPTGRQTLSVTYEPDPGSAYRAATANTTVVVEATDAALSVSGPETTRFAERFVANGTLTAGGNPVPGAPVRVTLGGVTLGTVATDANGAFSLSGPLPAGVATGQPPLAAELAVSGRAVAAADASVPVRVRPTDPALTLDVARSNGTADVAGRLAANGEPLENRRVSIAANGTTLDTVRTDSNGTYAASVDVPPGALTFQATVDGDGNLRDATAIARLSPVEGGDATLPGGWPWLVAALALLVGGVGIYAVRGRGSPSGDGAGDAAEPGTADGSRNESSGAEPDAGAALAEEAAARREAGEFDAAVRAAYAAARAAIDADPGTATHWEFYRAAGLSGRADEALRDLTAAYERAAFAPDGAGEEAADDALARLDDLR